MKKLFAIILMMVALSTMALAGETTVRQSAYLASDVLVECANHLDKMEAIADRTGEALNPMTGTVSPYLASWRALLRQTATEIKKDPGSAKTKLEELRRQSDIGWITNDVSLDYAVYQLVRWHVAVALRMM